MKKSRVFQVRVRGEVACFTRPEMKVERMSYEVMTPSAARGVLEAILWKPAISWRIERIEVGAPIAWTSFRRNEVNSVLSERGNTDAYFADEDRAQRNTVALRDVDYVVHASFVMTDNAGPEDNVTKFEEMFHRRLQKGQHFQQPYLGCREFPADASPVIEGFTPIDRGVERPLGLMFFDWDFRKKDKPRPLFFQARLKDGVLIVPSVEAVLAENGAAT